MDFYSSVCLHFDLLIASEQQYESQSKKNNQIQNWKLPLLSKSRIIKNDLISYWVRERLRSNKRRQQQRRQSDPCLKTGDKTKDKEVDDKKICDDEFRQLLNWKRLNLLSVLCLAEAVNQTISETSLKFLDDIIQKENSKNEKKKKDDDEEAECLDEILYSDDNDEEQAQINKNKIENKINFVENDEVERILIDFDQIRFNLFNFEKIKNNLLLITEQLYLFEDNNLTVNESCLCLQNLSLKYLHHLQISFQQFDKLKISLGSVVIVILVAMLSNFFIFIFSYFAEIIKNITSSEDKKTEDKKTEDKKTEESYKLIRRNETIEVVPLSKLEHLMSVVEDSQHNCYRALKTLRELILSKVSESDKHKYEIIFETEINNKLSFIQTYLLNSLKEFSIDNKINSLKNIKKEKKSDLIFETKNKKNKKDENESLYGDKSESSILNSSDFRRLKILSGHLHCSMYLRSSSREELKELKNISEQINQILNFYFEDNNKKQTNEESELFENNQESNERHQIENKKINQINILESRPTENDMKMLRAELAALLSQSNRPLSSLPVENPNVIKICDLENLEPFQNQFKGRCSERSVNEIIIGQIDSQRDSEMSGPQMTSFGFSNANIFEMMLNKRLNESFIYSEEEEEEEELEKKKIISLK